MKFTGHEFKRLLIQQDVDQLKIFKSERNDRMYEFWKRDPLAIPITTEKAFIQKLEYIHNNPLTDKWKLCLHAEKYLRSSAEFYLKGIDRFNMLTHYRNA
ncbi:MAG: hypothetical protein LH473_12210 [Chitinophagales bacterium]|nr:hypothetical protein [Chitinophagales bacterium]